MVAKFLALASRAELAKLLAQASRAALASQRQLLLARLRTLEALDAERDRCLALVRVPAPRPFLVKRRRGASCWTIFLSTFSQKFLQKMSDCSTK